ncbi:MAG TPA: thioredoxin domain-containing protein [bacterium]
MRTLILALALVLFPVSLLAQWLPGHSPQEMAARQEQKKAVPGVIYPVSPGDAPSKGPADAPVVVIEYSDFQCPYCQSTSEIMRQLVEKFPNKIRFVFKNHPLPNLHKDAQLAAEAALAAKAQGKFWEMHDLLFAFRDALGRTDLEGYARSIGLDMARFNRDLDNRVYAVQVAKEAQEVIDIGATGVPAVFVNGLFIKGSKPLEVYEEAVLAALGEIEASIHEDGDDEGCEEDDEAAAPGLDHP